ncbi:MAG: hypothetical protein ACJA0Q_000761 [Saprospiraceae bacterium]|jgi:hypothetical protein
MTLTKHLLSIACFLCFQLAQAQISPLLADSSDHLSITGNVGVYSTGLPLNVTNKFIFGGEITTSIKDNASSKLKGTNFMALEALGKLSYLSKSKTIFGVKNAFWGLEIGTEILSYNQYSDDLFNLVFYGNEPYAGQPLDLAKTSSQSMWFHNIGLTAGVVLKNTGTFNKVHISATPSFVMGVLQRNFQLSRGEFLTEELGQSIEVDFAGSFSATDSLYNAFSPTGYGAKLDIAILLESKKNKIGLTISDLGLISWDNERNYNLDTTFTFSGIEIEDIFQVQDTLITVAGLQDSLFTNTPNKSTLFLPALFNFYFEHSFSNKLVLKNWLKYRLTDNYIPFLISQINYNISGFTGGLSGAYGGYTGFQAGVHLAYNFKKLNVQLGTTNFLSIIDQKNQYSQNIYGRLTTKF